MNIFLTFLSILGPLAVFLVGFNQLSASLLTRMGPWFKKLLSKNRKSHFKSYLYAAGGTGLTLSQSSSVVFMISLSELKIIAPDKTPWLLLGINLGGTFAGWLLSLAGFQTELSFLALIFLVLALPFQLSLTLGKYAKGDFFTGAGLLLLGVELLNGGLPLVSQDLPTLTALQSLAGGPFGLPLAFISGAILGGLFRSSFGILILAMTLGYQGWLGIAPAAAMVLGSNLGFTFTGFLVSRRMGESGRQTALLHILINLIACLWGMVLLPVLVFFLTLIFPGGGNHPDFLPLKLAGFHTLIHLLNTLVVFPLIPILLTISSRFSKSKYQSINPSESFTPLPFSLPDALESNLLLLHNVVARFDDKIFELLMILMNVTQEVQPDETLEKRALDLGHEIEELYRKIDETLLEATPMVETRRHASLIQQKQRLANELRDSYQAAARAVKVYCAGAHKNLKYHDTAREELYDLIARVLDFVRFNGDFLRGKIQVSDEEIAKKMEAAIEQVREKLKKRTRKYLVKKSDADPRAELAFLEIIGYIEQIGLRCLEISHALDWKPSTS